MRIPMDNWGVAKLAIQGYAEDGVSGELGYDPDKAEWYVDLNDEQYRKYQEKLERNRTQILETFTGNEGDAVNIQGELIGRPGVTERRLDLYLIDTACHTAKGFKVSNSIMDLLLRSIKAISCSSRCEACGRRVTVVLSWGDVHP